MKHLGSDKDDKATSPNPLLKDVFDCWVDESIGEDEVSKILEPVLVRIKAGDFDFIRAHRRVKYVFGVSLVSVAALAFMVIAQLTNLTPTGHETIIDDDIPPLSSAAKYPQLFSGRIIGENVETNNIELNLMALRDATQKYTTTINKDGTFKFRDIEDGLYKLIIKQGESSGYTQSRGAGIWFVFNGKLGLITGTFETDPSCLLPLVEVLYDGVEISLCLTK